MVIFPLHAGWQTGPNADDIVIYVHGSGQLILTSGKDGGVDMREGLRRAPKTISRVQSNNPGKVFQNPLILGSAPGEEFLSAPGDVRAYDMITGKLAWQFHTIPHPGEFRYETLPKPNWIPEDSLTQTCT